MKKIRLLQYIRLLMLVVLAAAGLLGVPGRGAAQSVPETGQSETGNAPAAAEEPALSMEVMMLELGTEGSLEVLNLPEGVTVKSWKSSKPERVSVEGAANQARLKASKTGSCTITAKLSDGRRLKCKVRVPKVRLSVKKITLAKGQEFSLSLLGTSAAGKWKSSKKKVARVSVKGGVAVLEARKYGTAVITVTLEGVSLSCEVTVTDPGLSKESLYLLEDCSFTLKVKKSSGDIEWSSTAPEVAEVDKNGRVSALREGNAVIYAAVDGVTLSCPVTVASFSVNFEGMRIKVGDVVSIPVSGSASGGTWSCRDPKMAAFDAAGHLMVKKSGETVVTYTVGDSSRDADLLIYGKKAESTFPVSLAYRQVQISSLRNSALGRNSRYRFMQGCATDGTYGYFSLCDQNYENACALIKVRLSDWTVVKTATNLPIYHGNDLTYNSDKKVLAAVHAEGDYYGISLINPKTLKIKKTVQLDEEVYGVAYNADKKSYVFGVAGTNRFVIKNASFKTTKEFECLSKGDYTRQGIDCDKSYIYILQSWVAEGTNRIMVYDWKGRFVTQIELPGYREGESLFHVGKKVVVAYNDLTFNGGNMLETALRLYYQVRYTSGGGTGDMPFQMASLSGNIKLSPNTFKKAGYRFAGWKLTRSSDGKVCCRKKKNGKIVWLDLESTTEAYEIFLVPDAKTIAPMTTHPGDCITLQAQWTEN